jgi:hypothetical protein
MVCVFPKSQAQVLAEIRTGCKYKAVAPEMERNCGELQHAIPHNVTHLEAPLAARLGAGSKPTKNRG